MPNRLLDLTDDPLKLSVRTDLLCLHRDGIELATVPLNEIAAVVLAQPRISLSHAVLSGLASAGAALVVTNEKHLPVGMLLPLEGHFIQAERFAKQAAAPLPTNKRLWQQLIRAKVLAQSAVLTELHGNDEGINHLAARVKSGDPDNIEAQAARKYWPVLFDDPSFRRDRERPDQNRHLNYGYAVLRAIVARAICAAGLHPSIGLHHHNRYNAFCLADDLMEPLRPLVDRLVALWVRENDPEDPFNRAAKVHLITGLTGRVWLDNAWRTLFDVVGLTASSLAQVYEGSRRALVLPDLAASLAGPPSSNSAPGPPSSNSAPGPPSSSSAADADVEEALT